MLEWKEFVLWGSAGHAKVLASLIALRGGRVVALFDNDPQSISSLAGVPLFIGEAAFVRWIEGQQNPNELRGLAAIGGARGRDRLAVQRLFRAYGLQVPVIVDPSASVCATASLGAGTQVLAHAVVAADALVGEACIINHRASVDHECVLEDGVHLAPGSTLCGCVKLGTNVMIGAGAIILPRINIGPESIVGAGAVVTRDFPSGVIAFGNPARIRRKRRADE